MKGDKKEWLDDDLFKARSFAEKIYSNEPNDLDKAIEIASKYYNQNPDIVKEKVLSHLEEIKKATQEDEKSGRTYKYWIIQKCTKKERWKVYGQIKIIKASSYENGKKQCQEKDNEERAINPMLSGFEIQHKIMAGPFETMESALTFSSLCQ